MKEVPLCEKADENPLEHRVLPRDDPSDLEERLLELFLRLLGGRVEAFGGLGHAASLLSRAQRFIRKQLPSGLCVTGA